MKVLWVGHMEGLSQLLRLLFFVAYVSAASALTEKTYIVSMEEGAMPAVFASQTMWYHSSLAAAVAKSTASDSGTEKKLIHVYNAVMNGFAVKLTEEEAKSLESMPGVLAMIPDQVRQLHTTRTPAFMGLNSTWGLWPRSHYGSQVIVGVLDTGIWPSRESFSDHGLGPIPSHWKGQCQDIGRFNASFCNRKLLGARYFVNGYEAMNGPINETREDRSPLDTDGHGTHTASTAGGRRVHRAGMMGQAMGTACGVAPGARIAAYKVCWASGCFDSDILAAFDQAVLDGVNVISLSVGGSVVPYNLDSIAIGAFGAMEKGIFVSASGGNQGPADMSVTNVAPWVTTVGGSTLDRSFPAAVNLGNEMRINGVSLYRGVGLGNKMLPVVYAMDAANTSNGNDSYSASLCLEGSLDPALVAGKIVLCERGSNPRVAKGEEVRKVGGAGMILANSATDGEGLIADAHVLPAALVGSDEGETIRKYIMSTKNPVANIEFEGTVVNVTPAPVLASFSARGPSPQTPEVLKPDLIAPGVDILAAWTGAQGPSGLSMDKRAVEFNIISGTSMACPHVSGLAALLKGAHPDWSPAAIKSALMTTAYQVDNWRQVIRDEFTGDLATPYGFGAGHVNAQKALDPGLVYDISAQDYVNFLCSLNYSRVAIRGIARRPVACSAASLKSKPGDLNYPSLSFVFYEDRTPDQMTSKSSTILTSTLTRTVTNVGPTTSKYVAKVLAPRGVTISVNPNVLSFTSVGQKQSYTITVSTNSDSVPPGETVAVFGRLTWTDGVRSVSSPIVVSRQSTPF